MSKIFSFNLSRRCFSPDAHFFLLITIVFKRPRPDRVDFRLLLAPKSPFSPFSFPGRQTSILLENGVITLFLFASSHSHLLNLLFLLLLRSIYIVSREKFFRTLTFSAIGQSHKKIFTKCLHICPLKSEKQEKSEIPPS